MDQTISSRPMPRYLPQMILVFMACQPLLDVLSYFWAETGHSNILTLLLRMGLLGATALYAFCLSRRKKVYLIAAGVCVLYWAVHVLACLQAGYQDPVSDFTNYVRVVQIVVYALCFITFLSMGEQVYRAMLAGVCLNLGICALVMLLSVLTGTDPHTYTSSQLGVLGWFSTTNSQSSILSVSTPIVLMLALRYRGKGQYPLLILSTAVCFAALYFIGTRLAFASLLAAAVGLPVILALCRQWDTQKALILLLGGAVCLGCVTFSPMYKNQHVYQDAMEEKQGYAVVKMERAEGSLLEEEGPSGEQETPEASQERRIRILTPVYEWCAPNIVDRFGVETVIRKYNFSSDVQEITAARQQKIYFCQMLQDELPVTAKIFGMELGRMTHKNVVYDVENDFYGICFLYGGVGLALLLGFIGYFLVLIVKALVKDRKKYFTPMAGAIGMSLIIILVYACCTAGVLRRPNASVYLSLLLALVWYLVKIREYPETEELEK